MGSSSATACSGFHIVKPKAPGPSHKKFYDGFGCSRHKLVAGTMEAYQFTFNDPAGACPTCAGIGTAMRVHPKLLVPDPKRTLNEGAFVNAALGNSPDSWGGRMLYSLAAHYGFSLDVPFQDLAKEHVDVLFYGSKGQQFEVKVPPEGESRPAARRQEDQVRRRRHSARAQLPALPQAGHVERRHG
jgi:excinuclease ABC subunit A